ncbi:lia operon protein LiaF [Evansella vedderi]|uniref:Lia operon protein LiaF n=1 Tax=Evansella vedderi TaxID=38282 RepID=A0ABT9ZZ23_9BACI|nr:cell wall-active antibiotics response protein LiaF [Evansella vedderi]MDQ0256501.1 lia operon protein LiaF [Evansella vedderi]
MLNRIPTSTFNWIFLIGIALLFIELFFFNSGLVFTLLLFSFLSFIGRKNYHKTIGKVLFWVGIIILFLTIINMLAVRFLVIAAIALFFIHYKKSTDEPEKVDPANSRHQQGTGASQTHENLVYVEPLFRNRFFGSEKTSEKPYQWRDINVHGGFGDKIIDLSNTVLPDDPVISIRQVVGNVKIYVPYDVEVSILHSSLFGRATIFNKKHLQLFNQSLSYQTEDYGTGAPRVKIVTSLMSGDIEVKRI